MHTRQYRSRSGVAYAIPDAGLGYHETAALAELIGRAEADARAITEPLGRDVGTYRAYLEWDIWGYTRGDAETEIQWRLEHWNDSGPVTAGNWESIDSYEHPDTHEAGGTARMDIEITDEVADLDQRINVRLISIARGTLPCAEELVRGGSFERPQPIGTSTWDDPCAEAEETLPTDNVETGCILNQAYFRDCGGFDFDPVETGVL